MKAIVTQMSRMKEKTCQFAYFSLIYWQNKFGEIGIASVKDLLFASLLDLKIS